MGTLTNYEGLLALSTSPHLSQAMREYLVGVLSEHREMREALSALVALIDEAGLAEEPFIGGQPRIDADIKMARAILAKVNT